ncbi:hypothetical protein BDV25DRAFT_136006 [Aspergillus avenaceus]|uniref:Uncharacterized protein n=1 Tax=Aspergillus avenaceus TaxID=36643 RepID=A0A5N6U6N8_ASPAV|nr:hypothetical protein BDV25DRAFT_136006 [Aspergillus avenaceus]
MFKPLLQPYAAPKDGTPQPLPISKSSKFVAIRDTLTLSTWLLLGGLLQGLALTALGPYTLVPTVLVLLYRTVDHLLMIYKITPNRYENGVINQKYTAQHPNASGNFTSLASESIVVFHLGARSNHPLGIFAPGMKKLADRAESMTKEMTADPVKYGLLGVSSYIKQDNPAGNEVMSIYYLRDYEALHAYAHGPLHLDTMRWWGEIAKDHTHIGIYHETYIVPKGGWENIYANCPPTGMGATFFPVSGEGEKGDGLVSGIVDARIPGLRSAAKRFGMKSKVLEEREKEAAELYHKY